MTKHRTPVIWIAWAAAFFAALLGCAAERPATETDVPSPRAKSSRTKEARNSPTITPTPPVWWQQELYKVTDIGSGRAYLMAPQEVIEQVIAHYDEARALMQIDDLGAYRAALPKYYTGVMLGEQLAQAPQVLQYKIQLEGFVRTYEVKHFSADGLACTVGARQQDGKVYLTERATGETFETFSNTLTVVRMRYDRKEARWKGTELVKIAELGR